MTSEPQRALRPELAERGCPECDSTNLIQMPYPSTNDRWAKLNVVVCDSCGFGFVPEIDFDLDAYYKSEYGESHKRRGLKPGFFAKIDSSESKKVVRARWHAKMLSERFGAFQRVVDIGAGPGFFLHYVKAEEKIAIESDELSKPLLQSLGVKIVDRLDQVDAPDLIVMSHSLEHFLVGDYASFLKEAIAALRPGGLLLIEVPQQGFLNRKPEKPNGKGHEPHTLFFSPRALLSSVAEAELVYLHDRKHVYSIAGGEVDWSSGQAKETQASALMAIWRKSG